MEHDWLLLSIRYSNVTGIHRLATELDVADRRLASSVDDSHPCQLGVWLPHGSEHGVLAGKYLVTVRVSKLTNNRVLLAGLIAVSCQINQIVVDEFSSIWAFETAENEIGVRKNLFVDEAGAVQVGTGGSLHPLNWKANRSRYRSLGRRLIGRVGVCLLGSRGSRHAQQEQKSCFLHFTSGSTPQSQAFSLLRLENKGFHPEGNNGDGMGQGYAGVIVGYAKKFVDRTIIVIRCCICNYAPVISRRPTQRDDRNPKLYFAPYSTAAAPGLRACNRVRCN